MSGKIDEKEKKKMQRAAELSEKSWDDAFSYLETGIDPEQEDDDGIMMRLFESRFNKMLDKVLIVAGALMGFFIPQFYEEMGSRIFAAFGIPFGMLVVKAFIIALIGFLIATYDTVTEIISGIINKFFKR